MSRKREGESFSKLNFPVALALSEGVMPKLTAIDMALILFLARCTGGWTVMGTAWSLDMVAARLNVSCSGLKKSIARLKRLDVIESTRTLTTAHYDLTDNFRKICNEHLLTQRTIRNASLNPAVYELALLTGYAPSAKILHVVARAHRSTGLTGRELAENIFNTIPEPPKRRVQRRSEQEL